jgi:glycosyltransferase involved in cell wall biosynthesis
MRVLFVAADCNPLWQSLPALIWEYCLTLSEHVDLHLVTLPINRENIEPVRPARISVDYLDAEAISAPLFRLSQVLSGEPNRAMGLQVALRYPSLLFFERKVWKIYRQQITAGDFDVVHRASPMSPALPSYLSKKCPVPFVIGPVLGGLAWPKGFSKDMRREGEWLHYLRPLHKLLPFYRSTYRCADAVLAAYPHTIADLPQTGRDNIVEFSEGGAHVGDFPTKPKPKKSVKTILFVGRMVPFKQPALLAQCFAESPLLREHKLVMIGDGPEKIRVEHILAEHGLSDAVTLLGEVSARKVVEAMCEADVFAFPSIREQGGGVLTIASLCQTPSVVIDYGGPRYRVPEGCGIRVPLGPASTMRHAFTTALETLVRDDELVNSLGSAARKFASRYYSWEHKVEKTLQVYEWVSNSRLEKPDFWHADSVERTGMLS